MAATNLFAGRPTPLSLSEASDIASRFGIQGKLSSLGSERDQNFRIEVANSPGFVLKITHPAEPEAQTDFETAVLEHLAHTSGGLPVPRPQRSTDGALALRWPHGEGARTARILSFLPGSLLAATTPTPALRSSIGVTLAQLDAALRPLPRGSSNRRLLWDFAQSSELRSLLSHVSDAAKQRRLKRALDELDQASLPSRTDLRLQWLHNDFNPYNLLICPATQQVTGILDFGDMTYGPTVCDLAVACAYVLDPLDPLNSVIDVVAAYHAHTPLNDAEIHLLPMLIEARFAMTLLITGWRAELEPSNRTYILRNAPQAIAGMDSMQKVRAFDLVAQLQQRISRQVAT